MKTILAASDLSARSDRAVGRAALLARERGGELIVLHVVDEELPEALATRQADDARFALSAVLASLPAAEGVACDARVVVGEHYQSILAEVDLSEADLVVIGQHRKDVLLDLFRGSTGERIIRFGNRPVLVVKMPPSNRYLSVLVAVDFSPPSRRAIEAAMRLAPGADIRLVHAFDVPFRGLVFGGTSMERLARTHQEQFEEMIQMQMREFLSTLPKSVALPRVIAREGSPEEVVLSVAEEIGPDLVVVGTHGRSGIGRALLGSVAETVLARASCDVLAVRGW
jgi:nucleotide-binding universal stress UspA family protein